jgi:Ca2+-transporting ATPase
MLFAGTTITKGRGKAIVTTIGMQTEIGKIAGLIQEAPEKQTKLQNDLNILSKRIGIVIIGICIIVFLINVFLLNNDPQESFLTAIALSVAAIPEGLPAVVTIAL